MTTTPPTDAVAREAAAKALMGVHRGWKGNTPDDFVFPDPIQARSYADLVIDAFLSKALEGADEKLAEIQGRSDELDAMEKIQPELLQAYFNWAHEDRTLLLTLVAVLSAKLKEQKAAHAKMLRDEVDNWPEGSVESQVAEDFRRLADKIEGGE